MGKKIGRNAPCPCGSGKKYKYCCINKEDEENISNPEHFLQNYKKIRKEAQIKQCLHPDKQACSEKIIRAHSIQNNKILNRISTNGEVFMPCPKPDNPFKVMTKYGRKQATVFTGFCRHHDKTVFQPIEDNLFNKSIEHIFLYTYRCFAVEFHKKQEVVNMKEGILKRKPSLMKTSQEDDIFAGMIMAIEDLTPVKKQFDIALLNHEYDILTSVVWEFDSSIKFAGTGFEAPSTDLLGNKLQNLSDKNILASHIFIMVFPEEENTYCIISWLKENDDLFSEYYSQLKELDEKQRKNYINNILPSISENIAINPEAWNKWGQHKKDEFGSLLWGMDIISEISGHTWDRLKEPLYDLFEL